MSDESVHAALRSDAPLVVVEAPGGCGKTFQGAGYARDLAQSIGSGRLLILTHTHAACSVFDERTRGLGSRVEIRTIDSLITNLVGAYHAGLGLPVDAAIWARQNDDGYDHLAVKAAALLKRYPAIAAALAHRYPTIVCDEHQDSSGERHSVVMAMHTQGAKLRVFADPMQSVFPVRAFVGGCPALDWGALTVEAQHFEELDTPHRWANGCPLLGRWILQARATLKNGGRVDLRNGLPPSVSVVFADNIARANLEYCPAAADRRPIDAFVNAQERLLILTRHNKTAGSLRPAFNRRILLWEGHNRSALETFVDKLTVGHGNRDLIAQAVVDFLHATAVGFTAAAYVNTFIEDVADGCARSRRQTRAKVQELARLIVAEPNHCGAAKVLGRVADLRSTDENFRQIVLDATKEFYEGTRLGSFDTAEAGLAEISHRRTYSRPKPPDKAISTIHKAKGLECNGVIVAPCDAVSFKDDMISRCLLYVAMSRATNRLMFVLPRANPSPLLITR